MAASGFPPPEPPAAFATAPWFAFRALKAQGFSDKRLAQLTGKTENMRSVNFPGHPRLVGQFVDVVITEALTNSLRGRVAGAD